MHWRWKRPAQEDLVNPIGAAVPHRSMQAPHNGVASALAQSVSAPDASGYSVVPVETVGELRGHLDAWEALAAAVPDPNPFHEPWMLLPAAREFGAAAKLLFLLVYEHSQAKPRLCGLFPLERVRWYKGLPYPAVRTWQYIHCFDCTPLVRPGHGVPVVATMVEWLSVQSGGA